MKCVWKFEFSFVLMKGCVDAFKMISYEGSVVRKGLVSNIVNCERCVCMKRVWKFGFSFVLMKGCANRLNFYKKIFEFESNLGLF